MKLAEATIMVVDDEPELREIFATWLTRAGCKVLTAENGAEALKILQQQPVHTLVSDIRMPIMDGVTLVRRLPEIGIYVPSIIFVSGFGDVDAREVYALGVEAMLAKPLSRQQFMEVIETSLMSRQEMWTVPISPEPIELLTLIFASQKEPDATCAFALGRGGCCIRTEKQLGEGKPVRLSIRFEQENLHLQAHGVVRWCRPKEERTGIEFTYLHPDSRPWVLELIQAEAPHSFIPDCRHP